VRRRRRSIGDETRVPKAPAFPRHHFRTVHGSRRALGRPALGRHQGGIGDLSLAHYRKFVSNLTGDNIIARKIVSPVDLERSSPTA